MTDVHDDAMLARAAAAGDRAALGVIYDRYADRLHDFALGMLRDRDAAADCVQDVFVTAATKLGQLREADRLRPWLYAIARSECLARIRERTREQPSEELRDMPSSDATPETLAVRGDIASLIRDASLGLSDRDQVVLELAYRQGLAGPELADALGVTARNANTLVERMRDTFGRALGALLVSRQARANPDACPELAAVLADWDGTFTVLMRKRVARHIDDCAVCEERKSGMVNPAALLGAAPVLVPAPAWLRQRTLDEAGGALPQQPPSDTGQSWWPPQDLEMVGRPRGRRRIAGLGAAIVAVLIGAGALLATQYPRVAPTDAPSEVSATSVASTAPSVASRTASKPPPPLPPPPAQPPEDAPPPSTAPTAIPRTQQPEPPPPTSRAPFTRHTEPSTTAAPTTTHTTRPRPEQQQQEPEPEEPQQDAPTTPKSPKTKPSVPTVQQPPPVDKSPDDQCTPANPCAPVFS